MWQARRFLQLVMLVIIGILLALPSAQLVQAESFLDDFEKPTIRGQLGQQGEWLANPLPLPELAWQGIGNQAVRPADYAGKYLVINFWATWCPPCVAELPGLNRLAKDWQKHDVQVLTISLDDKLPQQIETYLQERQWHDLPVLLTTEDEMGKIALNLQGLPVTLLVDLRQQVTYQINGEVDWDQPFNRRELARIFGIDVSGS